MTSAGRADIQREEALSDRCGHQTDAHFGEVRLQIVGDAFADVRKCQSADDKDNQDHEQRRHHDLGGLFNAALDAADHDDGRQDVENQCANQRATSGS